MTLKERAAAEGQSLSAYVVSVLSTVAARPTNAEIIARLRARDRSGEPPTGGGGGRRGCPIRSSVIVVDTSAVVEAVVGAEAETELMDALADDVHAPHLLDVEVLSALRGLVLGRRLSDASADRAREDHFALAITRYATPLLAERVWQLRHSHTADDANYIALAERSTPRSTRATRSWRRGVIRPGFACSAGRRGRGGPDGQELSPPD